MSGCRSQADPKAGPVREDQTQTNPSDLLTNQFHTADGWRSGENQHGQADSSLCRALRGPDVGWVTSADQPGARGGTMALGT